MLASMCQNSLERDARMPTFGFAGYKRRRGRRQPRSPMSRPPSHRVGKDLFGSLGVESECADGHVPVLNRSDEVAHSAYLVKAEAAWATTSAARSVIELTVLLTGDPRVVASTCEADDAQSRLQGHDGAGFADGSKERFLLRPIAQTLVVEPCAGNSFPGE